jgi:hypothetical protein
MKIRIRGFYYTYTCDLYSSAQQLEEERDDTREQLDATHSQLDASVERESLLAVELRGVKEHVAECKTLLAARVATETALVQEAEQLLRSVDVSIANTGTLQDTLHALLSSDAEKRAAARAALLFATDATATLRSELTAQAQTFHASKDAVATRMAQLQADGLAVAAELKDLSAHVSCAVATEGAERLHRVATQGTWAEGRWQAHCQALEEAGKAHAEDVDATTAAICEGATAAATQFSTGEASLNHSCGDLHARLGNEPVFF